MGWLYRGHAETQRGGNAGATKIARMLRQRTLKTLTKAVGVGLHSGQRVEMTLRPAQPDTGIVFRRVDLPQPVDIPVSAESVTDTRLASTVSNGAVKVHTVEHLMSACAGRSVSSTRWPPCRPTPTARVRVLSVR